MNVLVTGASGFLGRPLVQALQRRGETVVTHSTRDGIPPHARGIQHVYHLAAKTYVPDSWSDPKSFYEVNVMGAIGVLDYCRHIGASLTLVSSYVYGRPECLPISEDHPLCAFNPYGHSKQLAEEVARFYQEHYQVPVTIVRPFNPYGPGQSPQFLIPTLIRQALAPECEAITVADHRPRRDYIFVEDVVDLLICLGARGGIYNAASGVSTSVGELAEQIIALTGVAKPVLSRHEVRPHEVLDTVGDVRRAREQAGWSPRVSLREGLERTIQAFREGRG